MTMFMDIPNKGSWQINQYLLFDVERQEITIFQPDLKNPITMSMNNVSEINVKTKGELICSERKVKE